MKSITKKISVGAMLAALAACSGSDFAGRSETKKAAPKKAKTVDPSAQVPDAPETGTGSAVVEPPLDNGPAFPLTWTCGHYPDANPHALPLSAGFNPASAKGFRLFMRPSLSHCEGIALELTLNDKTSGKSVKLPCSGGKYCTGEGAFHLGLKNKPDWTLAASDLGDLGVIGAKVTDEYEIAFKWTVGLNDPGSTCYSPVNASYGVGVAVASGSGAPPPATDANAACADPPGYDLTE